MEYCACREQANCMCATAHPIYRNCSICHSRSEVPSE
jgi:hypothetical protein